MVSDSIDDCGSPDLQSFISRIRREGKAHHRDLPWRNIDDAYAVLVSEVMLQQTQVSRVLTHWPAFLSSFPTLDSLAAASTSDVLEAWQGLGYNRRALALKRCANTCSASYSGQLPCSYDELLALDGIGPATAAGVRAFAFGEPGVYLETNVRTVFLHELFPGREKVSDKEIVPLVEATCDKEDPRSWYYALLDYGAYLKSVLPNPSRRSAHHTRQSAFVGSRRQKRAQIVRIVLGNPSIRRDQLSGELDSFECKEGRSPVPQTEFDSIVDDLVSEGYFSFDGEGFTA